MSNVQVVSLSSRLMRGWIVLALCLSATMFLGSYAQAQTPARQFRVGQEIEYKFGGMWLKGSIRNVSGELYLVGKPHMTKDHSSEWMVSDTIRQPGEAHEGPDAMSDQFRHRVGMDSVPKSLNAAQKKLAEFRTEHAQGSTDPMQKFRDRARGMNPPAKLPTNPAADRADPFAALPFEQPVTKIKQSAVRTLQFANIIQANNATSTSASLDPATAKPARSWTTQVRVTSGSIFGKVAGLATNGAAAMLVIHDDSSQGSQIVAIERFDMATGRSTGLTTFDDASVPDDISADGRSVLAIANAKGVTNRLRVDLWDWSQEKPTHVVSFKPAIGKDLDYIAAVQLLHDGSILVKQNNGITSAYQAKAKDVTALWTIKLNPFEPMETSPGRQQIAIASGRQVVLINATTGDTLASLDTLNFAPKRLAFSQNGRYILVSTGNMYVRWDLKTGEVSPRFALSPSTSNKLLWISDSGNVFDGLLMLDHDSGAAMLRYESGTNLSEASISSGILLSVDVGDPRIPGSRKIWVWPAPDTSTAAQENLAAVPNLFAPGSHISIDFSAMEGSDAQKQQLQAALTEQLAAMNVTVSPGQATSLVGRTTTKNEEKQFRDQQSPLFGETKTANVTSKRTTITLHDGGQAVWQTASTAGMQGFSVSVNQGESLQQALDRQVQVKVSRLAGVALPNIVPAAHVPKDVTTRQLKQ